MSSAMAEDANAKSPSTLEFHYIKSPHYHEVLCDGVIGGLTPNGRRICLSIYSERGPLPRVVEYTVNPEAGVIKDFDEQTSTPTRIESRQGVIRNVETTVYLEIETAKQLIDWLQTRITENEGRK
jgi:hypothetical protein